MNTAQTIVVTRGEHVDASAVAARAAKEAGTTLASGLRWYGTPPHREASTTDGRTIRVYELDRDRCSQCRRLAVTETMVVRTDEAAGVVRLLCPECANTE